MYVLNMSHRRRTTGRGTHRWRAALHRDEVREVGREHHVRHGRAHGYGAVDHAVGGWGCVVDEGEGLGRGRGRWWVLCLLLLLIWWRVLGGLALRIVVGLSVIYGVVLVLGCAPGAAGYCGSRRAVHDGTVFLWYAGTTEGSGSRSWPCSSC